MKTFSGHQEEQTYQMRITLLPCRLDRTTGSRKFGDGWVLWAVQRENPRTGPKTLLTSSTGELPPVLWEPPLHNFRAAASRLYSECSRVCEVPCTSCRLDAFSPGILSTFFSGPSRFRRTTAPLPIFKRVCAHLNRSPHLRQQDQHPLPSQKDSEVGTLDVAWCAIQFVNAVDLERWISICCLLPTTVSPCYVARVCQYFGMEGLVLVVCLTSQTKEDGELVC